MNTQQSTITTEQRTILEEWVAALESKEFVQGRGALAKLNPNSNDFEYCCIGVLAELEYRRGCLTRTSIILPVSHDTVHVYFDSVAGNESYFILPDGSRERLGLSHSLINELISMNDTQHLDFRDIASYIREYFGL